MSVDFYECDVCGESRYEEYVGWCTKCEHALCTNCLIDRDKVNSIYASEYGVIYDGSDEQNQKYQIRDGEYEVSETIDDTSIAPCYCPFCSGGEVHNDELLEFALSKLSVTHEQLVAEYKEARHNRIGQD